MKRKAEKQQKHKNSGHTAAAAERKRKRRSGGLILVLLCAALLAAGVLAVRASRRSKTSFPGDAPPVRSLIKSIAESTEIMRQAKELKKNYRTLAELIREQKVSEAAEQLRIAGRSAALRGVVSGLLRILTAVDADLPAKRDSRPVGRLSLFCCRVVL